MSGPKAADFALGWPRRCLDLKGLRVRFRRDARNGSMFIPAGLEGEVQSAPSRWDRLDVRATACECCGVAARITVHWSALEPIVERSEAEVKAWNDKFFGADQS